MAAMKFLDLVPEYIRRFEPYYPSKPDRELMRLYGASRLHRLNNNENDLGPPAASRAAIEAMESVRAAIYPNGDCFDLRHALAQRFGKTPEQYLVGNGSCEVIGSVIRAFCQAGDNIVTADKTFAVYEWVAELSGFEPRLVPLRNYGFDPQAMLDAMDRRTKVVFVCNPNNPTGTYWDRATLHAFLDQAASRAMVVIDEAYFEYVDHPDYPNGMELLERYPSCIVFRTFSKMYGLAALRVGYLAASAAVVDIIRRTQIVYSVNGPGQVAAEAALRDDGEHIAATRRQVAEAKGILTGLCHELDLPFVSGEGNFFMIKTPISDTLLYRKLMARGVMIRTMTGFRFPGWIRVSTARRAVMEDFCEALRGVLRKV